MPICVSMLLLQISDLSIYLLLSKGLKRTGRYDSIGIPLPFIRSMYDHLCLDATGLFSFVTGLLRYKPTDSTSRMIGLVPREISCVSVFTLAQRLQPSTT